jgi:hypothetical protein
MTFSMSKKALCFFLRKLLENTHPNKALTKEAHVGSSNGKAMRDQRVNRAEAAVQLGWASTRPASHRDWERLLQDKIYMSGWVCG